ncbi:glycoside hydrolase family 3 protein [Brachybacterium hainanense]|uniref:beta-glucosidase n=1 Tax=Brachybacterium hainanense TaxID=1541174 RepID=A0ABV6R6P4_9MICO
MTTKPAPITLTAEDGTVFRDLDHDGAMAPFEDPRRSPDERAADLTSRLSLEEKVGLMFHSIIETTPEGELADGSGAVATMSTEDMVLARGITHANVHALPGTARLAARWSNRLQELAARGRFSIPVTVSTDPRHSFAENSGAAFSAGSMSAWPEPLGLGALDDPEGVRRFADAARREYRAVGIHAALHPQIDLATEPRWGRQFHTFGPDAERVSRVAEAYLDGFQISGELGPDSVACMAKHFPGGGPQKDGEDPHFPYGREQVYPGGRFELHLEPFRAAIARGVSALMPYYGMPVGLVRHGEEIEEVGFGFNRQVLTGILREELGFDGVICSDWGLLTDTVAMGLPLPARAWGVEHLNLEDRIVKAIEAGVDQFGGEECPEAIVALVHEGRIAESRIDESARRLLRVKFQLGLFEDPFVDEDAAEEVVGAPELVAAGREAQAASTTVLQDREGLLPLRGTDRKVFVWGLAENAAARLGTVVASPQEADLAIIRLEEPFEPRADLFLEPFFHQGSLEYRPGLLSRIAAIAQHCPVLVDAKLLRPAILAPLTEIASVLVATYGSSSEALVDALSGAVPPRGTLPFEIPASMEAVRASETDVPGGTENPTFPVRHGIGGLSSR